jgi:hypothetical protein
VKKSDREIMEILEAFDATGVAHSAAALCDADPKTVRRYAQARDLGRPVTGPVVRPKLIDPFLGQDRGVGGPVEGQGPGRQGAQAAGRDGVRGD